MIKVYKECYNKQEFYGIMGHFFAEKKYKKEMPYLGNEEGIEWYLKIKNGIVTAFHAVQKKKGKIEFKYDYYMDDIKDLDILVKSYMENIRKETIETAVSNKEIEELFKGYGFKEYKRTVNYRNLRKEESQC